MRACLYSLLWYESIRPLAVDIYRLKPDYIDALVAYANVLVDQGINNDAIDMMERAISLANDADMFNNYGAFYTRLGNHGDGCRSDMS